jgi:hypothetical protein
MTKALKKALDTPSPSSVDLFFNCAFRPLNCKHTHDKSDLDVGRWDELAVLTTSCGRAATSSNGVET